MPTEEMKLESVNIDKWIEVFKAGEWDGNKFTEKDIDEAITNFNDKVAEPYLTIDHNPGITKETKRFFETMNLGVVSELKRVGESLMAKFKNVPKLIAELINSGSLAKRSVEWWIKFKHASGEIFNNVLEGITFHGANGLPAISNLADIPKLFKEENTKSIENGNLVSVELKSKQEVKNIMEITKEEYQELLKHKVNNEKLQMDSDAKDETTENLKSELKTNKDELTKMKTEKDELLQLKADIDKKEKESVEKEASDYVDGIIKDEKLLKKFKDMKVSEYIRFKNEKDEDSLKLFKEDLESRDNIIDTKQVTKDFTDKDGKINFKKPEYSGEIDIAENQLGDMDKMDDVICAHMKNKGYTDEQYNLAAFELGLGNKSDVPEEQLQ